MTDFADWGAGAIEDIGDFTQNVGVYSFLIITVQYTYSLYHVYGD